MGMSFKIRKVLNASFRHTIGPENLQQYLTIQSHVIVHVHGQVPLREFTEMCWRNLGHPFATVEMAKGTDVFKPWGLLSGYIY